MYLLFPRFILLYFVLVLSSLFPSLSLFCCDVECNEVDSVELTAHSFVMALCNSTPVHTKLITSLMFDVQYSF